MVRSAALLLWAQLLGLVGSQPLLLTVDPPWAQQFNGDTVKLTCGDPGVSVSTSWYNNWQAWRSTESNHLSVMLRGKQRYRFQCRTRGSELSPVVNVTVSNDWLLLQVPTQAVLEGDALTLRCRAWENAKISDVQFFHDGKLLQDRRGDKLLLSPAQQRHSGRYHCEAYVSYIIAKWQTSLQSDLVVRELFSVPQLSVEGPRNAPEGSALTLLCSTHGNALRPHLSLQYFFYRDGLMVVGPQSAPQHRVPELLLSHSGSYSCQVQMGSVLKRSAPITITVRRVPVAGVSLQAEPPGAHVLEGGRLVLSCAVAEGSGPLSFSWHRQSRTRAVGAGPRYELPAARLGDSDHYRCTVSNGVSTASSPQLLVTVTRVPVAGVSLQAEPPEAHVLEGGRLVLSCAVAEGSGPLSFSWHRRNLTRAVGAGPRYELPAARLGDGDHYRCTVSNGVSTASSPQLLVTVVVPVSDVSIAAAGTEAVGAQLVGTEGEGLTLSCAARTGTEPPWPRGSQCPSYCCWPPSPLRVGTSGGGATAVSAARWGRTVPDPRWGQRGRRGGAHRSPPPLLPPQQPQRGSTGTPQPLPPPPPPRRSARSPRSPNTATCCWGRRARRTPCCTPPSPSRSTEGVRPRPHGTTAPPTRPPSPTQRCRPPAAPPTPGGRSAPTATAMRTSPGNKPPPPPDGPFALPLTPLPHVLLSPTWDKRPPNPPNTAGEGDGGGFLSPLK
ncbi:Fc receptor-like protein 3 isoform X6 [Gallus gallus]|uniref:Fc receptor-like protein 3 isoform X6 n=1 Tax=Gallus gallus TaxID=9031 RepID=UPI001F01A96F|nr:Fc receptor-like protein 3 isoform X6 [Gallus gallus]